MPNLQTSIKDLRQNKRKQVYNLRLRKRYKSAVKTVQKAIDANNEAEASKGLVNAQKTLDKAAKKKVINANTASRKKSRLAKKYFEVFKKTAANVKTS